MEALRIALLALALAIGIRAQTTPVIGGSCKLGTPDVQIGGKQTQFFLKCETSSDAEDGSGVWVVKSRAAAAAPPADSQRSPSRLTPRPNMNPHICEQDNNARESEACTATATCLQLNQEEPSTYLQCEQTSMRWVKKRCADGLVFNFEQQTCIVPKRVHTLSRQQANGLICTYSSCSNSNPCQSGTCNNGYCCSSNSAPAIIATVSQQQSCPGGAQSYGNCNYGQCAAGYTCQQSSNQCCPNQQQNVQPSIIVSQCPGGGSSSGSCFNGGCSSGYSCNSQSNLCCPIINPFLCQDGTQAAGGCVSGQCGAGYSCVNGLCCVSSSNTPKCLDGSEAVGACIPSCVAGQCGNQQVQYFCGTGYTCTAGNICCPTNFGCQNGGTSIGPPVNGLCPTGYELSNNQCCSSATCSNGGTSAGPAVNGLCPTGYILLNGLCCSSTTAGTTCDSSVSIGPCFNGACPTLGYTCDANGVLCCPLVDYTDQNNIIGRAVEGDCPEGYTPVPINGELMCVTLQSIPGICDASEQAGPCVGNQCPSGYYCFTSAAVCCPSTLRVHRAPSADMYPGRPISYLQASMKFHDAVEEEEEQGSTTAVTPVASTSPAAASTSTTETTETVEAASTTSSVA